MFYSRNPYHNETMIGLVNGRRLVVLLVFPFKWRPIAESFEGVGEPRATVYALDFGPISIALSPGGGNVTH